MSNQSDTQADRSARNRLQISIAIAYALLPLLSSSTNVALPRIGQEFAMNAIMLAWVSTSFLIPSIALLLPLSRIADTLGRKRIFTWGVIVFNITCILCALPTSGIMLIIFRAVQGVGGALCWSTGGGILASAFPASERGKVFGINAASVFLGLTIGPLVGGFLTQHFGWRSVFWANLVPGLISLLLLLRLKGEWVEAKRGEFDLTGSIISALAIVALIYGFSLLPEASGAGIFSAGVVGTIAFIWWELRAKNPLLNIKLFTRNRVFAFSNLAALINFSATLGVSFLVSLYLQYSKGLSPQKSGLILMAMPVMQAILSPVTGRLSDRVVPQRVAATGLMLSAIGLGMLAFIEAETGMALILVSLFILGAGAAFFAAPNTNAVMSSVDKQYYNVSSAMLSMMRQFGMMVSMGIIMVLFSVFIGRVEITPQYYDAFVKSARIAFAVYAVSSFLGTFASLASQRGTANRD
jgi:EmrB/QacA subfamily drug resistance transporter